MTGCSGILPQAGLGQTDWGLGVGWLKSGWRVAGVTVSWENRSPG